MPQTTMITLACDKDCDYWRNAAQGPKGGPCRRIGCDGTIVEVAWLRADVVKERAEALAADLRKPTRLPVSTELQLEYAMGHDAGKDHAAALIEERFL